MYTKKIRKLITKNGYSDDDALVINLDEMKAGDTVLAHLYKLTGRYLFFCLLLLTDFVPLFLYCLFFFFFRPCFPYFLWSLTFFLPSLPSLNCLSSSSLLFLIFFFSFSPFPLFHRIHLLLFKSIRFVHCSPFSCHPLPGPFLFFSVSPQPSYSLPFSSPLISSPLIHSSILF